MTHAPRYRDRASTSRIIIHESHTGPDVLSATAFLRARGRANGLLDIGYHLVVERDGWCRWVRPHRAMGSHAPGCNHDSIGVCFAGEHGDFRDAQLQEFREEYQAMSSIYGRLPVFGHDEVMRRRDLTHRCPSLNINDLRAYLGAPNATTNNHEASDPHGA